MFINRGIHSYHIHKRPSAVSYTLPYAADFNGTDAYLDLTSLVNSDDQTRYTFSVWMRVDATATDYGLFFGYLNSNNYSFIRPRVDGDLRLFRLNTGTTSYAYQATSQPANTNWHHYVMHFNSNEALAADRFKVWVDGSAATVTISNSMSAGQALTMFSSAYAWMRIGTTSASVYLDGRLADVIVLDGIIEPYTSFGYDDAGTWKPKVYDGGSGYGSCGFRLDFADNTDLGKDVSGNANHFTNVNVTQSTDIPENPA